MLKLSLSHQLTLLSIPLLLSMGIPTLIHAQTPEPTTDPEVTSTIKERVQKVLEQNPEVKGTVGIAKQTFALIGTLEKSVGSTLQIKTYQGSNRVVELDKNVMLIKGTRQLTKEELELNAPILLMGTFDENQTYLGKRLVVSEDTIFPPTKTIVYGLLTQQTTKALTLSLYGQEAGTQRTIPINSQTVYFDLIGQKIKRASLAPSSPLIIVFDPTTVATPSAKRVYTLSVSKQSTPLP